MFNNANIAKLFNFQLIYRLCILLGISIMLLQCSCKVVTTIQLGAGAKIQVFMLRVVEYRIYRLDARYTNRCRWQATIDVGIKWWAIGKVLMQNAFQLEVTHRILDCRAGSEGDFTTQAVDINAREGSSESVYQWLADNCHRYGFILRYTAESGGRVRSIEYSIPCMGAFFVLYTRLPVYAVPPKALESELNTTL